MKNNLRAINDFRPHYQNNKNESQEYAVQVAVKATGACAVSIIISLQCKCSGAVLANHPLSGGAQAEAQRGDRPIQGPTHWRTHYRTNLTLEIFKHGFFNHSFNDRQNNTDASNYE